MKKAWTAVGIALFLLMALPGCGNPEIDTELAQAKEKLAEMEHALQESIVGSPVLVHSVFFWLKEGVSEAEKAAFVEGCKKLGEIESVAAIYVGPPASTPDRDVVDHSFDTALIVHFNSMEDHDTYQDAALHQEFIQNYGDLWERVLVYDNSVE